MGKSSCASSTTYHALKYEQVMKMFGNQDSIRSLITSLNKQGRIYYDKESGLLCDNPEAAKNPDHGTIAAFWVLLDFEKPILFHTSGDFPVKLHFFSEDEEYEILYVPPEQEILVDHVMKSIPGRKSYALWCWKISLRRQSSPSKGSLPFAWWMKTAWSATMEGGNTPYRTRKISMTGL